MLTEIKGQLVVVAGAGKKQSQAPLGAWISTLLPSWQQRGNPPVPAPLSHPMGFLSRIKLGKAERMKRLFPAFNVFVFFSPALLLDPTKCPRFACRGVGDGSVAGAAKPKGSWRSCRQLVRDPEALKRCRFQPILGLTSQKVVEKDVFPIGSVSSHNTRLKRAFLGIPLSTCAVFLPRPKHLIRKLHLFSSLLFTPSCCSFPLFWPLFLAEKELRYPWGCL